MKFTLRWLLLTFFCALLACAPTQNWQLDNIAGHLPDLQFTLRDDQGRVVTAADYQGKIVLLYFGFTSCEAECPTAMARLGSILKQLGTDADKIQVLFVSIDPAHDTPKILHDYVAMFDAKHMTGLTGDKQIIENLAKRYRIAAETDQADHITHSDTVFVFDRHAHAQLLLTPDDSDAALLHDLRQLME